MAARLRRVGVIYRERKSIGAAVLFTILALPAVAIKLYFRRMTGSLADAVPNMPTL
jgi:uncharacterized membrane-anchored protein